MQDAHDRQPVMPGVKPSRPSRRPDRGEMIASALAARAERRKKNIFTSALRKAESVAQHVGNVAVTTAKVARHIPAVKFGEELYKAKSFGDLGHAISTELGEETGMHSINRIRRDKGTVGDWATVGALALPGVGRAAGMAVKAAQRPAMGIVSRDMQKAMAAQDSYISAGKGVEFPEFHRTGKRLDPGNPSGLGITAGARPLKSVDQIKKGGVYFVGEPKGPKRFGFADNMGNRLHWVHDMKNDAVIIGQRGQVHGDIIDRLNELGGNYGYYDVGQGFLHMPTDPYDNVIREAALVPSRDIADVPKSMRKSLENWIGLLTRNLRIKDEHVRASWGEWRDPRFSHEADLDDIEILDEDLLDEDLFPPVTGGNPFGNSADMRDWARSTAERQLRGGSHGRLGR